MRTHGVLVVIFSGALLALALAGPLAWTAGGQEAPPPKLFWSLRATSVDGQPVFVLDEIIVPTIPTLVNVTVTNDDPDPGLGALHTFTIRSAESETPLVDLSLAPGETASAEFLMVTATQIEIGARNETTEAEGGALRFFCRPHEALQMIGAIVEGGVQEEAEPPEKGVFLRAYWIGLLGIAGTFLLVGISYFVIKGSSRHFKDHHEHIRRGGP